MEFMIHEVHIFQITELYAIRKAVNIVHCKCLHVIFVLAEKQPSSTSQLYIHLIIFKLQQLVLVRQFQRNQDMENISRKNKQPLTEQWGQNTKTDKIFKKKKKNSQDPLNKLMKTPEKKRKKPENKEELRVNTQSCSQTLDFFRQKEPETARPSQNHKKHIKNDNKKKPIPSSPVDPHHSRSASHSKHKRHSRSKSATKMSTHRSTIIDSKPILPKTPLKSKNNESNKDTGKGKLKKKLKTSTSREKMYSHTEIKPLISQTTPLKSKNGKEFDVAKRDEVYISAPKQSDRQKLKPNLFDSELEDLQSISPQLPIQEHEQRKIKLKKLVPSIKTEYSQRRGSYFDEEKLRRMENFHKSGKRVEIAPPLLMRSARKEEMKIVQQPQMILQIEGQSHQKSTESHIKQEDIEGFKREQEKRWRQMLEGLHDLKNGQQIHQKIDQLIDQLNQNYIAPSQSSLQVADAQSKENQVEKSKQKSIIMPQNPCSIPFINQQAIPHQKVSLKLTPVQIHQSELPRQSIISTGFRIQDVIWTPSAENQAHSPINQVLFEEYYPPQDHLNLQTNDNSAKEGQIDLTLKDTTILSEEKRINQISMSDFYNFTFEKNDVGLKEEIFSERQLVCSTGNVIAFKKKGIRQQLEEQISVKASIKADIESFNQKDDIIEENIDANSFKQSQNKVFLPLQPPPQLQKTYQQQSSSLLLSPIKSNVQIEQACLYVQNVLFAEFANTIIRNSVLLHNFLIAYQNIIDTHQIYEEASNQIECSQEYSMKLLCVLLSFLNRKYGSYLLQQVRLPFECRPIDVLRYIRGVQEQEDVWVDNALRMPLLDGGIIQVFQTVELTNPSYRPDYLSYHHCLYDLFNDVVDELRPYGNRGKAIFSLELGIVIPDLSTLSKKVKQRFLSILRGEDENQQNNWKVSEQGIFEVIHYLSLEIIEVIINEDILAIHRVMRRNC